MLGRQRSRWETRAAGLTSSGSRHGCTGWCRTGAPSHEPARGPAAQQDLVPTASIPTLTAAVDDSNRVILLIILWTDVAIIGQRAALDNRLRAASVTDTVNSFLPTSTATATEDGVTGAA